MTTIHATFVHQLPRARDWQIRPEFEHVCNWWRQTGRGVMALVGIGGTGKTAIVDQFLRRIPAITAPDASLPKDDSLPSPRGVFVYSFYDETNPEQFFEKLYEWFLRAFNVVDMRRIVDSRRLASSALVIEAIETIPSSMLLILDGLEKVQDDSSRSGVFGRLNDPGIREFLLRASAGLLPSLAVLLTTRFSLGDLDYASDTGQATQYRRLEINRLPRDACIQLLRRRGVQGTNRQLDTLAVDCGEHALTVDLVATYLARFAKGDPSAPLDLLTLDDLTKLAESNRDPRFRWLLEQSYRFERVVGRYEQALSASNPIALRLLQHICLFRLGVTSHLLVQVFTGYGKERLWSSPIEFFSLERLQAALGFLTELGLVETRAVCSDGEQPKDHSAIVCTFTVHPAVRDTFLRRLDDASAKVGHDAARHGLVAILGRKPGATKTPSDPSSLDILEELIYHTLHSGYDREAWNIYDLQVGSYVNLGWKLGDYERGRRICQTFSFGKGPESIDLLGCLDRVEQSLFLQQWGMYSWGQGELATAVYCFQRASQQLHEIEKYKDESNARQDIVEVLVLRGHLAAAEDEATKAVHCARLSKSPHEERSSLASCAHIYALRGQSSDAFMSFRELVRATTIGQPEARDNDHSLIGDATMESVNRHQRQNIRKKRKRRRGSQSPRVRERGLSGTSGVQHSLLLWRLGHTDAAIRRTIDNRRSMATNLCSDSNMWLWQFNLVLALLAIDRGDVSHASSLLDEAHAWASQRNAREPLCWCSVIRARIILIALTSVRRRNDREVFDLKRRMARCLDDGLTIARECGFGIYHIDLLLLRARLALFEGRAVDAERDVRVAVEDGVHPSQQSGFPDLVAASSPECGYAWGIAEGHELMAESLLLRAAQELGRAEFAPARFEHMPAKIKAFIENARKHIGEAIEMWGQLRPPEIAADSGDQQTYAMGMLERLAGGVLTEFPIEMRDDIRPTPDGVSKATVSKSNHACVFVCYAHADNRAPKRWLSRLLEHLAPLIRQDELAVWSDQGIKCGDDWKSEIRQQLHVAKVAILLVSPAFLASTYIANCELPILLKRANEDGMKVLPVLLSPSLVHKTRFRWPDPKSGPEAFTLTSLQTTGAPSETLSELTEAQQDRALMELAELVLQIIRGEGCPHS